MALSRNAKGGLTGGRKRPGTGIRPAPPTTPSTPTAPVPTTPVLPTDTTYKSTLAALLPHLSGEDQKTQGMLYGLTPVKPPAPVFNVGGETSNAYLSQERAAAALKSLGTIGGAGPGTTFLKNAIGLLQQYGGTGGEGMSSANYQLFSTQLSDLLSQVKGDKKVAPYAALAQIFLNPTFAGGGVKRLDKTGAPAAAPKLFT